MSELSDKLAKELYKSFEDLLLKYGYSPRSSRAIRFIKECCEITVENIKASDPLSPSELTGEPTTVDSYKRWEQEAYNTWDEVIRNINNLNLESHE